MKWNVPSLIIVPLLMAVVLALPGCRGKNAVEEVSLATSGVELKQINLPEDMAWPGWRGPTGDGHAVGQTPPTRWSSDTNIVWQSDVPGRGHSSPIVVGSQVFLATAIEDQQQQVVLAYDRGNGRELWRTVVHAGGWPNASENHNKGTNANATLVSDGTRIYATFFNSDRVYATALDLKGSQLWQTEVGAFSSKFGFAPSPLLYKSFVIVTADSWGGGYLAALDNESGKVAWRKARPAKNSHSTPLLARVGGREQLVLSGCDLIVSYDAATGEQLWSTQATTETTCGTMVTDGTRLVASGGFPGSQTICLDSEGEILWQNRVKIYEPSLVIVAGNVFAVSDNGIAYCWSLADGTELWKKRLGGNFSGSPIVVNDLIYVSDLSGKTYIFRASGDGYEEVAVNRLGDDAYASPAVCDDQLLMRIGGMQGAQRQERLVCIGE